MESKVAFVGAGCVGKTTLFNRLKQEYDGQDDVLFVSESAREYFAQHDVPHETRLSYEVQKAIQTMAMEREQAAERLNPRLMYCDRSVADAAVYAVAYGDSEGGRRLLERVRRWVPTYTRMFLLDPADIPHVTDSERLEDDETRQHLHRTFVRFFALHDIRYDLLSGSLEQRLKSVLASV